MKQTNTKPNATVLLVVLGAAAVLGAILTLLFSTPAAAADAVTPKPRPEIVNFDGCDARLVPGTNYYNLVDPRCKTVSSKYSSSPGEDARREREAAAAAAQN